MKIFAIIAATMVLGLTGVLGYLSFFQSPTSTLPIGYYGQLNRVKHAVSRVPGLTITDVKMHRDITLEDFYVTVRTPGNREFTIDIFDGGHVRDHNDWAKGLIVEEEEPPFDVTVIPFQGGSWTFAGGRPPQSLEDFLPQADAVFEKVDHMRPQPIGLTFEEMKPYIRIRYVRKIGTPAP